MFVNKRHIGSFGENLAVSYLQKLGYKIVERNFRTNFGEIDIIAQKDNFLVFVEVKYRQTLFFGRPEEAVNKHKLNKLKKLVDCYYLLRSPNLSPQIEVLSIWQEMGQTKYQLIQGIIL